MGRLRALTTVAVLSLAAVACGGDDVTPGSGGTTPAGNGATSTPLTNKGTLDATALNKTTLELDDSAGEFYFKPTFIKVKTGQELMLELENEGSVPHTFTITSLSIDKEVGMGAKDTVSVTFPAAGTADVEFFCRFHGTSGMRGAFYFGSAPQSSGAAPTGGATGDSDSY